MRDTVSIRVSKCVVSRLSLHVGNTQWKISRILIIVVRRRGAEEQPRERELSSDGIAGHLLLRNVQENPVVVVVRKTQRTVGHGENVLCSQSERVGCGGSHVIAEGINNNGGGHPAVSAVSHTILMYKFPKNQDASVTVLSVMTYFCG